MRVEILERRIQEANCTTERKDSPADGWLLGGRFCVWNVLCLADFKDLQEKPALFWEHKGRLFPPVCHVSCVRALGCSILSLGVLHGPPKKTPIERIYREVTGYRMPQSIKRILLRKRTAKRKPR